MSHDRTQSDDALVRLAQSGELWAFDELARRHQPTVLRFLRRRLSGNDVEDVAQESLVRAFERLRQCRPETFKSWLLAIVYRQLIDHLRRPRMQIADSEAQAQGESDPAQNASDEEHRELLWSIARRTLSEEQFTAVWLFYAEDMATTEIARVMNRSWVSVKVMLHRARTRLAEHVDRSKFEGVSGIVQAGES